MNRQPFTIVGVAPAGCHRSVPELVPDLWPPIAMRAQVGLVSESALTDRNARMFLAVARLGRGVALQQARAECAALVRRLGESNQCTNLRIGATVLPIRKGHFGGQTMMEEPLQILMAACGVLLLVVCANVANLLLARATVRRKEFGVRGHRGGPRAAGAPSA